MELTTIVAVSEDLHSLWQVQLLMESFKEFNFKYPVHILVFKPKTRPWSVDWGDLPVFKYEDSGEVAPLLKTYHTIHRAYSIREHLKANPELENRALLYLDMDILLTKELNLDHLLQDNISYGADIRSYNNWEYFTNKVSRVKPERMEQYLKENPLGQMWERFGISEETIKANNDNTAGVHYLLKGTNVEFWNEVLHSCVPMIKELEYLNQKYIQGSTSLEKRNNGWQSFCSDIFITLYALWKRGLETRMAPELNFTWATDSIEKIKDTPWYHNAAITSESHFGGVCFYKGRYVNNDKTPFQDKEYIKSILQDPITKNFANYYYTLKIKNYEKQSESLY